jgi:hypothetical protein
MHRRSGDLDAEMDAFRRKELQPAEVMSFHDPQHQERYRALRVGRHLKHRPPCIVRRHRIDELPRRFRKVL